MKLLVTGGLGFLGSTFIRHMLSSDPSVQILNVDKMTYAANPDNLRSVEHDARYAFLKADIANKPAVFDAVASYHPDAIVNYAAESHVDRSILEPAPFVQTDVVGTYNLLEATRAYSVPRYVQVSTDEVYGDVPEGESDENAPYHPSSPYSASKAGGDLLVRAYFRTFHVPAVLTHGCNCYGPNHYPEKLIPLFITNLLEGKKIPMYGEGTNVREWLFSTDHAKAIAFVLREAEEGGVYNIGSRERLTNLEVTHKILAALGKDESSIEYVADRPGHDVRYAPNSSRLRSLGWKPEYNFERGLAETVAWFRANETWWKKIKTGEYLEYYRTQYGNR